MTTLDDLAALARGLRENDLLSGALDDARARAIGVFADRVHPAPVRPAETRSPSASARRPSGQRRRSARTAAPGWSRGEHVGST
jgi:hypothetical protein